MDTLEGRLLIASPRLPDPNFHHSVVLIIQHNENGAFGLILNRITESNVGEVWSMVAEEEIDDDTPVHFGGPVAGPLLALHTDRHAAEKEVLHGVYFSTQRDRLVQIVVHSDTSFRLYSGYSGWGPGQLENEIKGGGWMTLYAREEFIFGDPDGMWKRAAQEIGEDITRPLVAQVGIPGSPSMN